MKYYIVNYVHKDLNKREKFLKPHFEFLEEQVKNGNLVASGPIENNSTTQIDAFLIFNIQNEKCLFEILKKDPFWKEGLVDEYKIDLWEPWFGDLNNLKIANQ